MIGSQKSKGGISAYKIGKQWKIKCSKLDDWIASGKVQWNEGWYAHNNGINKNGD